MSAVATRDGIARIDADGRAEVLARFPDANWRWDFVHGIASDRIAWRSDPGTFTVTGLRAGDPVAVDITGVATSSSVSRERRGAVAASPG